MDLSALENFVRVPTARDKVYKEECMFSFHNTVKFCALSNQDAKEARERERVYDGSLLSLLFTSRLTHSKLIFFSMNSYEIYGCKQFISYLCLSPSLSLSFPKESEGGLFVCLNTFMGFSRQFVEIYHSKTGHRLFLNIQTFKSPVEKAQIQ